MSLIVNRFKHLWHTRPVLLVSAIVGDLAIAAALFYFIAY
jgi:hypothetical protein